jgi:hypothetical protein
MDKTFLILVVVLLLVAYAGWLIFGVTSPFTRHAFYKVKSFSVTPTRNDIPLLELTFEKNGNDLQVRKSAEYMSDEEHILIWTAMTVKEEFPLLVHIHISLWQHWNKQIDFTVEPALIPDGVQHG